LYALCSDLTLFPIFSVQYLSEDTKEVNEKDTKSEDTKEVNEKDTKSEDTKEVNEKDKMPEKDKQ
jgi:hypothetical protein